MVTYGWVCVWFFGTMQILERTAKAINLLVLTPIEINLTIVLLFLCNFFYHCQNLLGHRKFWLVLLLSFNEPAQSSWMVKKDTQL